MRKSRKSNNEFAEFVALLFVILYLITVIFKIIIGLINFTVSLVIFIYDIVVNTISFLIGIMWGMIEECVKIHQESKQTIKE